MCAYIHTGTVVGRGSLKKKAEGRSKRVEVEEQYITFSTVV